METQSITDFQKFIIKIGTIIECEKVDGSEKLLKLIVDFGSEKRQILSGIAKWYEPQNLIDKQASFIINLEPRKIMGIESQGMILATEDEFGNVVILSTSKNVPNGSQVH